MMQKFMNKMESFLAPLAAKVGGNRILKAVSTAFNMVMPIIIIGSVFTLLSALKLGSYQQFLADTGLGTLFALPGRFTISILSLYVSFTCAYAFLKNDGKVMDAIPAGIISLMCFMILTPLANITIDERTVTYLSFDYLGAKGLFTAIIVGLCVGVIYNFLTEKGWVIKMPEGVPPTVAKSFNALIPGFILTGIFLAITGIFNQVAGVTFNEWHYNVLSAPLQSLSGSIVTYCILMFISSIFWFFGLHGGQITTPIFMILFMQAGVDNQTAFQAGTPLTNILTVSFLYYLVLGGTGNTIGLAIDMLFFSKSNRYKALGKLSILPSCCSINEPIVFGMPIILNPIMAIPFFIIPQIITILTYFVMKFGLVSLPRIAMGAGGTPLLLDGFLICGISGLIWQIILIVLTAVLYYPFFKVQDNIALKEEQAIAK